MDTHSLDDEPLSTLPPCLHPLIHSPPCLPTAFVYSLNALAPCLCNIHNSRSPPRRQRSRTPPPPQRPVTPPLTEIQRDARTIVCMQLSQRCRAADLGQFLQDRCGDVRSCKIITDRNSGRSKGIAYVEFYDVESVPKSLALNGELVLGVPIMINLTESEKNRYSERSALLFMCLVRMRKRCSLFKCMQTGRLHIRWIPVLRRGSNKSTLYAHACVLMCL